jgi:hypothetical protein
MTFLEKNTGLFKRAICLSLFYMRRIGYRLKLLSGRAASRPKPSNKDSIAVTDPGNPTLDSVPVVCRDSGPQFGRAGVPTAEGESVFGTSYETEDRPSQGRL